MIYIVRHGQTEWNSLMRLQGRSDNPLSDDGIAQAKNASYRLKDIPFSAVYSSPLKRAIQTAEILVPNVKPVIDDRLIEMDAGPYDGMDLQNPNPKVIAFFKDFMHNPVPEGMETLESVVQRAGEFLEDKCRTEDDILVSTHAIAMKGALEYMTPESKGSYWAKNIGNCDIYASEVKNGKFSVPVCVDDGKNRWEGAE